MEKRKKIAVKSNSGPPLSLPALRLLVSPLRLMNAFVWQVVNQRNVMHYGKVEEFVTVVTEAVPDLLSFKQRVQLILGLRARMILELFHTGQPNVQDIQRLLEKMNMCSSIGEQDAEVESSQANFVSLVHTLMKNPYERKHFFQEEFNRQYGSKYDTALQALVGGLVFRLEQLLSVPDLCQIASMISASPSDLEDCGKSVSDPEQLKLLLQNQNLQAKTPFVPLTSSAGDCVLSSLSFRLPCDMKSVQPDFDEPAESEEAALNINSPASVSDVEDLGVMSNNSDHAGENSKIEMDEGGARDNEGGPDIAVCDINEENTLSHSQVVLFNPQVISGVVEGAPSKRDTTVRGLLQTLRQQRLIALMNTSVIEDSSQIIMPTVDNNGDQLDNQPVELVSVQQWVSHIESNSISHVSSSPQSFHVDMAMESADTGLGSSVVIGCQEIDPDMFERSIIRRKKAPRSQGLASLKKTVNNTCQECGRSFLSRGRLEDHRRMHTGEKPFKCPNCFKFFRTLALLSIHLKTHSNERPFSCDKCGKCFLRKIGLQNHQLVHTEAKPYICAVCGKGYTQAEYLKRHMFSHTGENNFPCSHCPKAFPTKTQLSAHERYHTRDRPYACEHCGLRFFLPCLLKRHMGYHIGDRQFLCAQCGRTFVYEFDLRRHQKDHEPTPKLPCSICQKMFANKSLLHAHIRRHSTEKPYRCDICDKTFKDTGGLRIHKRGLHSNIRPYTCDECGKSYKLHTHLREHKFKHSGEGHTCEQCGKAFKYRRLLKAHERLHSGERAEGASKMKCVSRRRKKSSERS
ncbi:hypothetical protein UPYG_G00347140 [Umbra pygmaea]|uniref:C2H2-type domain-containing protein n=1 Tax=Umbra pygmaea TaxID=75934 RepID=A0ABD0VXJ0_UMBPY